MTHASLRAGGRRVEVQRCEPDWKVLDDPVQQGARICLGHSADEGAGHSGRHVGRARLVGFIGRSVRHLRRAELGHLKLTKVLASGQDAQGGGGRIRRPRRTAECCASVQGTVVPYVLAPSHLPGARWRHSHVGGSEIVRAPGPCAARTEAPRGATACRPARQLGLGGRGQAAQADREDRRREQRTQHLGFEIWGLGAPFHGDREALGLAVAAGKEDPGARINVVVEGAVRGDFVGEGGGEVGAGGGVGGVLREELDNLSMSVALSGGTALGGEFELMKRGWRISTVLRQRMGPNQN